MIKLTNATKEFTDTPILLNPDFIVSIYGTIDENDELITMIYSSLQQTWVVKETVNEIFGMISK
jgi:hypothetical protein